MKALCQHMQTNCIFNNHTVDVVITALKLKYYDAIIPGIDITPERQKQVAFTQSYLQLLLPPRKIPILH